MLFALDKMAKIAKTHEGKGRVTRYSRPVLPSCLALPRSPPLGERAAGAGAAAGPGLAGLGLPACNGVWGPPRLPHPGVGRERPPACGCAHALASCPPFSLGRGGAGAQRAARQG